MHTNSQATNKEAYREALIKEVFEKGMSFDKETRYQVMNSCVGNAESRGTREQ